ncbi:MAG: hypothetical protein KatS3mg102_0976 [Planctomycetota bacterium]|nr:MAG: hypothetical protein KatS3mg102_0976 [Planctomycetota bacterium]
MANKVRRRQQRRQARQARRSTEFRAAHRWARSSARKVRLIADQVRGLPINDALEQLQFSNRRAAKLLDKVVRSALANAEYQIGEQGLEMDVDDLVLAEVQVDEGLTIKRWMTRARGMAYPILKRTCHIEVTLRPPPKPAPATAEAAPAAEPAGA